MRLTRLSDSGCSTGLELRPTRRRRTVRTYIDASTPGWVTGLYPGTLEMLARIPAVSRLH